MKTLTSSAIRSSVTCVRYKNALQNTELSCPADRIVNYIQANLNFKYCIRPKQLKSYILGRYLNYFEIILLLECFSVWKTRFPADFINSNQGQF